MIRVILIALALVAGISPAAGQSTAPPRCDLMIDASGSMEGFRVARAGPAAPEQSLLMPLLAQLRDHCQRSQLFGDRYVQDGHVSWLKPLLPGEPIAFNDDNTNLGPALSQWLRDAADGSILMLVTDNVADNGVAPNEATKAFHDLLNGVNSPFSHITVLALRAPFEGKLFGQNGEPGVDYPGPRAFTVYLLGKGLAKDDTGYSRTLDWLEQALARTGRTTGGDPRSDFASFALFDVKPFANDEFSATSIDATIMSNRSGGAGASSQCAGQARFDRARQSFLLIGQPMGSPCSLNAEVRIRMSDRWCLKNTQLDAIPTLRSNDAALTNGALRATVTPAQASLCRDEQKFLVTLNFDPFAFNRTITFMDRLRRTFRASAPAVGRLDVVGTVTREDVGLGEALGAAWSYADPGRIGSPDAGIQRRIYHLDDMVRAVVPEAELHRHRLVSYGIMVDLRYPLGPIFVVIVLLALLIAALVLAVLLLGKARQFLVESDGGGEWSCRLAPFATASFPPDGGATAIRITNVAVALLVGSSGSIRRGRILGTGGGTVVVGSRRARLRPQWLPRPAPAGADDFDDLHGDPAFNADDTTGNTTYSVRLLGAGGEQKGGMEDDVF